MNSVAVFQTAFLGDLLLCIPLLKNIRSCYPNSKIYLVCRKPYGKFFLDLELVDEVLEVDKKNKASIVELKTKLERLEVDLLLCPHESFRSAILCKKIKSKKSIGAKRWFSDLFFSSTVLKPHDLPDALRQSSLLVPVHPKFGVAWLAYVSEYRAQKDHLLASLDLNISIPEPFSMTTPSSLNLSDTLSEKLSSEEKWIGLAPGSVWNTKKWRSDHFVELGNKFRSDGYQVVLLGAPNEFELCSEVGKQIPESINLAGETDLTQLYLVLKRLSLLVSNDSGTMHMAAVAGTKTLSVFGPTTLDLGYRPWQKQALVAQTDLSCRPCGKHGHDKCPIGTHQCMKDIKPSFVKELSKQLL
ncbi:MAG: glycosyltransferase family 9 protein [Bdellovibrionales bacterium]